MDKFSCLLSCYKKENPIYLQLCLDSIYNQSLMVDEVLLVEDGPLTEDLYDVISNFENLLPLKRIILKENLGLGAALNIGLKECKNDIVFRMDTDDICKTNRFEKQMEVFRKNPDLDIVGSYADDIDSDGNFLKIRKVPENNTDIVKYIWSCPLIHPSVAYKKESIIKIGSYDVNLKRKQDYDLWFRAVKAKLKFYNIQKSLIYYRYSDDYFKKNNFKVAFSQFKIALRGLNQLKVSPIAYLAILVPLLRSLLPIKLAKLYYQISTRFDPRNK